MLLFCANEVKKITNVHKTNFCPSFYENRREGFDQKYYFLHHQGKNTELTFQVIFTHLVL